MKPIALSAAETKVLAALAVFGLLVPNGVFVYFFFAGPEITGTALTNPISLVFICEAFFLMFLFAWLLKKAGVTRPSGLMFVIMSLIGSMAFSVPATICMMSKSDKS